MKADGGTLVYILIGLISVIISAVEKNRKKKLASQQAPAKRPASETQEQPQPSWQKELEDIFGKSFEAPQPEINDKKQEAPAYTAETKPVIYPQKKQQVEHWEKSNASIPAVEKSTPITVKNLTTVEDNNEFAYVDFENFDARKAIIYTEVFNRKYF